MIAPSRCADLKPPLLGVVVYWVYRRITEPTANYNDLSIFDYAPNYYKTVACAQPTTGSWQGFQNTNWETAGCVTTTGCPDSIGKSGNVAFAWAVANISDIFTQHGW